MSTRPVILASLAACLLFAGCDDSKNPLSDAEKSKPDMSLAGLWRETAKGGDVTYYHVGAIGDKAPRSVMRVLGITHIKSCGNVEPGGDFVVFPAKIGANSYLNLTGVDEPQIQLLRKKGWNSKAVGFWILRYKLDGDTLTIWHMDDDAKTRAIEGGKIKGVIERNKIGPDRVEFTDTTENLARFVASAGESLFSTDDVMRLERVK
jgi:hypothetical protein